jgi:phytoene dehydrogenase-like protein
VKLVSGEQVSAQKIVSNADPRTTFTELLEPRYLETSFVRSVQCIRYRGSAARVHLALSELPRFTALEAGDAEARLRAPIQIAPSLDYIERAYDIRKYGRY